MRRLAALALALGLLSSCESKPVTYTTFLVEAKLDPATVNFELLNLIEACAAVAVTPQREDSADLRCKRHFVAHNLGKFEYTTTLTSGTINFILLANDFNQQTLARGESGPVTIEAGKVINASVTAVALPRMPEPGDSTPPPDAGASDW
jgi:hypothetical protein